MKEQSLENSLNRLDHITSTNSRKAEDVDQTTEFGDT